MATIDPTKREALQKAYEGILDSKNNQAQVVNVVDYIAGGVIQKIVDMDDLAAASVWLDKLANVTHKNLEEFKNDLTAWPTLGLSKTRNMDEERSQLYQLAEWIVQLKDSKTTELKNFSEFKSLSKSDKKQILFSIQSKLKTTNALLLNHAGISNVEFKNEKISFLERLHNIIVRLGTLASNINDIVWYKRQEERVGLYKQIRDAEPDESKKIHKKIKSFSLFDAVNSGDVNKIQALLDEGVDPNIYYEENRVTPLHLAVQNNQLEIVKILLEKRANPNAQDIRGETPLHECFTIKDADWEFMAVALLEHGADPNISNNIGSTPFAVYPGQQDIADAVFYELVKNGADPFVKDMNGKYMKHYSERYIRALSKGYANRLGIYDFWVGKQGKVHWGGFIADAATPEKHIIYLLCFKQPDDLPFILKNASHDFIKAAIAYAVENKRADVLLDIFKNYQRDSTFKFLKNEANLIKKIEICLKEDVILQSDYKKIIIDKLELIGVPIEYEEKSFYSNDPLFEIVNTSNVTRLKEFLLQNPDANLNVRDVDGNTLLAMAYTKLTLYHQVSLTEADELQKEKDTKEIFSLLLAKSNINIRTLYNQSLLHLVTSSNQSPLLDVVILLLKGANPFARDDAGKTSADYLFNKEGSLKEGMLHHKEILGKMIDFFILPENFDELLKKLLEDKKRIDQFQGNDEDVSDDEYIENLRNTLKPYLRDYPTITGINGNTMLHRCLTADNYQEQALTLINKEYKLNDLNAQNNAGNAALHIAVLNNDEKVVEALLVKGVNPNAINNKGEAPIDLALNVYAETQRFNKKCILLDLFLKNNVQLNASQAMKMLEVAAQYRHVAIVSILFEKYKDQLTDVSKMFDIAGRHGCIPLITMLLEKYPDKHDEINLALLPAINHYHTDLIKKVIEHAFNQINKETIVKIFHWAVVNKKLEIVNKLLEKGVDPDIKLTPDSETMLQVSIRGVFVWNDGLAIIKLLLENGADPNVQKSSTGDTPLTSALYRNTEIMQMLLEKGADPDMTNMDGWSFRSHNHLYPKIPFAKTLLLNIDKGKKHLQFLLENGNALEELPYSLKKPYPELLKALIAYAAEKGRADVLQAIFDNYNNQQLSFLNNESKLIQAICLCLKQDSLLAPPIKIKVIEKLKLVSPANIKKIQLAESDIRGIPVSSDQKPTSHSFFYDKNSLYARMITAIENNNAESMPKIISESPKANFNIKDNLGRTLLDIAYTNKCKFETQYSDTDEYRYELFHYKKMIFILLIHLNINDRTVQQKSILHIAAEEKASFVDLAIFLLRGVDPDMRDASGKKAIDYLDKTDAKMNNHRELLTQGVSYLLKPENNAHLTTVVDYFNKQEITKLHTQLEADVTKLKKSGNKQHLERMQQSLLVVDEMMKIKNTKASASKKLSS